MRKKLFTHGITFFTTLEMYEELKKLSDSLGIGTSDVLRGMIKEYFNKKTTKLNKGKESQDEQ